MSLAAALFLGLGFGVKHAIEADHLAAVCTLVNREGSVARAAKVGALWGLGHGVVIMVAGGALVATGASVPEPIALALDALVALMLIGLGAAALRSAKEKVVEARGTHAPAGGGGSPANSGANATNATGATTATSLTSRAALKRPFAVGIVHGASGTAALTLLVASTVSVRLHALAFIALFGLASIAGMALVAALVAWPLRAAGRRAPWIPRVARTAAGAMSIAAGLTVAWTVLSAGTHG